MTSVADPDPANGFEGYASSALRAPQRPLVPLSLGLTERCGPAPHPGLADDADLTAHGAGAPIGERILVSGRLLDATRQPLSGQLVEIWQANAAGRYDHELDQHHAPLDPGFVGAGRCRTDSAGWFRFLTIRPGAYPWANHANAWRPAHIHFSVFGPAFTDRLVTQMYFPGDPLLAHDPIYLAVRDEASRHRLVADLDLDLTVEGWALGYRFDIVLGGRVATPAQA